MTYYAGIDVSLEYSGVCVVDGAGKIMREQRIASEPEALIAWFRGLGFELERIGLEAGPMSQWLAAMRAAGLAVELLVWMVVRIRAKMAQRKKLAWPLRSSQLLLAVERLVANDGWVTSRVKAVSRRRRGPQARLYRACHLAILDHRGRRLTPATLLPVRMLGAYQPAT